MSIKEKSSSQVTKRQKPQTKQIFEKYLGPGNLTFGGMHHEKWAWLLRAEKIYGPNIIQSEMTWFFFFSTLLHEKRKHSISFRLSKRIFDIVISLILLVVLIPLFLLITLLIRLDSAGDIFFTQLRPGHLGVPFRIWKFRTMRVGSDLIVPKTHVPFAKLLSSSDLRTTKIGAFLRNWKLDELPQLFNVIKGDMSLVGPRTGTVDDCLAIHPFHWDRFTAKPGLTGLWQAYRPNTMRAISKIRLDVWYARHPSLLLDCWLLVRSLSTLVLGEARHEESYRKHRLKKLRTKFEPIQ